MKQDSERHFEDFVPRDGSEDVLGKVEALDEYLRAHPRACLDGLGVQVLGPAGPAVRVREHSGHAHDVIMLGSNSYLSLTTHPVVVAASREACERYGYGMGAVSLYAGTTDLHRELERLIAAFYGAEDCIVFPTGYAANVGVISALCGPGDTTVNDVHNHASIFDGCRLSGADTRVYLHGSMRHLEKTLRSVPDSSRGRLVITDGVFSMDGDTARLDEIVELSRRYGARVMIDEAHAVGVVGPTGRGTTEKYRCQGQVDITVGTLSKAPGAIGGYCVGSAALVRYLRLYARTYFFSTSLPAPVVAGLIEVFRMLSDDSAGRERLWERITYLVEGLNRLGFDTGETASAIVPVMVRDEDKLGRFHGELRERGVFTNIVTFPAVRRKECRLRLSVMNSLSTEQLDYVLATMADVGRRHGVV